MPRSWLLACAACLLLVGSAGCDDPSTVGAELIDEEGGDPITVVLPPGLEADTLRDLTGNAQRVFAGAVDDPLLGHTEATGYVDLTLETRPSGYEDSTLTGAFLRLTPDYVYGDTTATVRLALYEIDEAWEASGVPADTSLQHLVGDAPPIAEYDVAAGDTLVDLRLPGSWVTSHADDLRAESFSDDFHGFQLRTLSDEAVIGVAPATSGLRVETEADTVAYTIGALATTLRRTSPPTLPDEHFLIQDGLSAALVVDIEVADSLRNRPINQFELQLSVNSDALEDAPAGFYRPMLQALRLSVIDDELGTGVLFDLPLDAERERYLVNQPQVRAIVQDALLNGRSLRFRLAAPSTSGSGTTAVLTNTLDALVVRSGANPAEPSAEPSRAVLILTPLND